MEQSNSTNAGIVNKTLDTTSQSNTRQYGVGRKAWYTVDGKVCDCYMVCIAGGSASGKTSVAHHIIKNLSIPWIVILSQDNFYKELNAEQRKLAAAGDYDFDHPNAIDFDLLKKTLWQIKKGKQVDVPNYCFRTHSRLKHTTSIYGANILILEGLLALLDKDIIDMMDLKIFVDTDSDTRLSRRIIRDMRDRGRTLDSVLSQYEKFVKPAFDKFIQPTLKNADIIIPRGMENTVALDIVVNFMKLQFSQRPTLFLENSSSDELHSVEIKTEVVNNKATDPLTNLIILKNKSQITAMHTILRNKKCSREDFIFYSERLSILIIEKALELLPFEEKEIATPMKIEYKGKYFNKQICGVSIMRGGDSMEIGLRKTISACKIGKLLIRNNITSNEPELHFYKLPNKLDNDYYIFLMDSTSNSGRIALMAIRILIDHHIQEENIIYLTFILTKPAVKLINKAFPKVKIVTSMVDPLYDAKNNVMIPGIGDFANRYFGTED